MKTARKLFLILLLFIVCLGLSSCTLIIDGLELKTTGYVFDKIEIDGVSGYSISLYKGNKDVVHIPKKHLFRPILQINYNVFYNHSEIKEVHIPETVWRICSAAFDKCPNLTYVSIPDSIREVSRTAFAGCEKLQYNEYENGFYLGNSNNPYVVLMKAENAEGSFPIHEQTKVILSETFLDNDKITSVVIPDGVQVIDEDTFSNCKQLNDITFGKSVKTIEDNAFYNCSELTRIELPATVTEIGKNAFSKCSKLTQLDIPVSTTEIGSNAFSFCSLLTRVSIPDTITKISDGMFSNCYSLPEISFGKNVTEIGHYAFACCHGLTRIDIPDSVTMLGAGVFKDCANLSEVSVPDSIETLADSLFHGCHNLSRVVLNKRITKIGNETFSDCKSLKSIDFPENLTQIGTKAFYHCESLANVNLPNNITSIGNRAFSGCTSFTSFNVPDNTQVLDASVLDGCSNLKKIHFGKSMNQLTLKDFETIEHILSTLFTEDYLSFTNDKNELLAYGYSLFFSSFALDNISIDADNTTFACKNNCLIQLENKSIITSCKNYTLPDDGSVDKVYYLGQTETLYIPESILFVSQLAIAAASPETITVADNHPVYRCKGNCLIKDNTIVGSGKNYTIPSDDDVNTIVFLITSQDLFIPKNITYISPIVIMELKQEAFSIAEDNPVYEINGDCLIDKSTKTLKRAWDDSTIPNDGSIETIGNYAFASCNAEELTLPSSIKTIQTAAFWGYYKLTTIRFAGTINEWNAIDKLDYREYTIICSDGTIFKVIY